MADISTIFRQIALLFTVIAIGFVAAKGGVINKESNRHLSNLVMNITNPCTILYAVVQGDKALSAGEVLLLTAIAAASYGFMILLAHFLPKVLHVQGRDAGVYRFMFVFSNVGFFGFPVVQAIFGSGAVFYAAIFNLVFQLLAYTYGVRQISGSAEGKGLSLLLQPIIIASLLGYVLYFTDQTLPAFAVDVLGFISAITSPLCMLVIGCTLAFVPLRQVFLCWRLYPLMLVKHLLIPVLIYLLLSLFVDNPLMLGICVIMPAMPIAVITALFCAKYDNNQDLAASGVFLSTLLSIGSIPFLMWALFS